MTEPSDDPAAADSLMPVVYDELRQLAGHFFRNQKPGHTLQPTALVNEAYMRLARQKGVDYESRTHFFNVAAQAMRQILTDHVRRRNAEKRGGGRVKLTLDDVLLPTAGSLPNVDLLDLLDALERLAKLNQRHAEIVTLRFFAGLTVEEVAGQLDVSRRTVVQDWQMARAWLMSELKGEE